MNRVENSLLLADATTSAFEQMLLLASPSPFAEPGIDFGVVEGRLVDQLQFVAQRYRGNMPGNDVALAAALLSELAGRGLPQGSDGFILSHGDVAKRVARSMGIARSSLGFQMNPIPHFREW